jgi:hypothetical protein
MTKPNENKNENQNQLLPVKSWTDKMWTIVLKEVNKRNYLEGYQTIKLKKETISNLKELLAKITRNDNEDRNLTFDNLICLMIEAYKQLFWWNEHNNIIRKWLDYYRVRITQIGKEMNYIKGLGWYVEVIKLIWTNQRKRKIVDPTADPYGTKISEWFYLF